MDILKVLSRGTRKPTKSLASRQDAHAQLPSAGVKANPQLYHDEIRGLKRKKSGQELGGDSTAELPNVDFFASKEETLPNKAPRPKQDDQDAPSSRPVSAPTNRLTQEECRQLLRSHRLKITLMYKDEEQEKVKKPKKKKKEKEKPKTVFDEKKGEKKQLFPQPLESFGDLRATYGISRRLAENLVHERYRIPTEVQMGSLPLLLRPDLALSGQRDLDRGVDFLAVAPTGSGKTISFLIPAVANIMRRRAIDGLHHVRELEALVVAPTRELVHQIVNEGRKIVQGTGIKILAMKKGMRLAAEKQVLAEDSSDDEEKGSGSEEDSNSADGAERVDRKPRPETKTDILVTTPLLLLNFLRARRDDTYNVLPSVRDLVLDEADVLLDPLFRQQTLDLWAACSHGDLRVSFWSATMGSNIESLVTEKLEERARRVTARPKPLVRLVVGLKDTAVPNIVHKLTYTASEQGKLLALRQLLHPSGSAEESGPPLRPPFLVFTQTIDRAMALHEELKYDIPLEAGGPTRIAALHSALADSARSAIMRKFRAGEIWVLITTDVLARGVDFAGVNGVINFDVPGSAAAYVHRAGRTGRAGRQGGVAVTFYTKDDIPFVKTVANVIAVSEKQAGKTGDEAGVHKWLLDALPNVKKADKKKLKERGVESRRGGAGNQSNCSSLLDERGIKPVTHWAPSVKVRGKQVASRAAKQGGETRRP